ncbi:TetR/AcrR family transcriptional regulator [Brachybacterium hainanense]|uniref:TetR/AcrR family transcriptional regulator n=1 Tax=Brachybacterium hainanense TaxID=1541174 RepID=A0ABV6RCX3_9MICO
MLDALEALAREGCAEVTMGLLSERAGISRAALYANFGSLDGVLTMLMTPEIPEAPAPEESRAARAVRELHALVDCMVDRRDVIRAARSWRITSAAQATLVESYADRFEALLLQDGAPVTEGSTIREDSLYCAGGLLTTLNGMLVCDTGTSTEELRAHGHASVERILRAVSTMRFT